MRHSYALVTALLLAGLAAGCATSGSDRPTEAQVRDVALGVAAREAHRADSDLYRIRLGIGVVRRRTAPSGSAYWDVTLVDGDGIRRLCVRVRSGGQSVGYRRCDPDGAPPPGATPAQGDDQDGDAVRS